MPTIKLDAAAKLLNTLLERITPALAVQAKHSYTSGYLQERATLFSTMYHEWSTLQKDTNDTMEAVSSLDWSVAPYVTPGAKPSARAKKVADTVAAAIWHVRQQAAGGYAHGFLDLVGAMLDGLYRGVSVHEIIWARDAQLVYPAEYRQVPAQFYIWETRPEHEDRLLLVRDGMSYSKAEPFPRDRFIIALNTTGSDHPLFNAIYHSLVSYFLAAKQGLPWMLEYCERYCHPSRVFTVGNKKDVPTLQAALAQSPIVTDIFLSKDMDATVDVEPIPGGANIPHEALLRVAENACHQAILGQTLTSDTSENGGSRAQAEVHLGVQKSVVMQRAEYVARVLNRQLVPAIVAANFGRTEGIPMPEIKFAMPDDGANAERANYWGAVLSLPGISVPREHVYESLRIPMPAEGDDTLGAQSAPAAPPLLPREQEYSKKNDDKLSAAKAAPPASGLQLLTSMADSIEVLRYWRKRGLSSSYILQHLPELSAEYNSAHAANPYGCNQYGEGWAEPHDGNSTGYQQMGPGKPERKVLTTEHGGNKVEKVTHDKHPGKGAYEHADNNALDKTAKEEREKREKAANTPSAFADSVRHAMSEEAARRFDDQMHNAPEDARNFFKKHIDILPAVEASPKKGSYMTWEIPPHLYMAMRDDKRKDLGDGFGLIHEVAHCLDLSASQSRQGRPLSDELKDVIKEDVKAAFDAKRKEIGLRLNIPENLQKKAIKLSMIKSELTQEINASGLGIAPVCDAFGAEGLLLNTRHAKSYYKTRRNAQALETFANMYATHFIQNEKQVKSMKKYLPKTYERFIMLIKE